MDRKDDMTTIYWFSGTGNSFAVAREMARCLGEAKLVPMSALRDERVRVEGTVGIVCPVYFYGLPLLVREHARRLDASQADYVFLALTSGGFPGAAAAQGRKLLRLAGREPDAIYSITAPGNYIAMYDVPVGDAREDAAERVRSAARRVAASVRDRVREFPAVPLGVRGMNAILAATFGKRFAATCRQRDRRFYASEACTRCGLCARICPVGNVELSDGRPHWLGRCEQCFACIHWCPAAAIQLRGAATGRRGRYHHPEVSAEDITAQRP